jgi:hypothetical protein
MHPSSVLQFVGATVVFGKAAIGGAGLTLAILGAINALLAAAHSWLHVKVHFNIETPVLWYLMIFGAIATGLIGVRARPREQ